MTQDETYRRVRSQFGRTARAYVASPSHVQGAELEQMVGFAATSFGTLGGRRVLDIATGGGHTALAFARAGAQVTATDLTPEMLDAAQAFVHANGGEGVCFTAAAAENLPFADAGFDLVTCRIAAHHFADPECFVGEAARVLKPGGLLLLVDNIAPEEPGLAELMNAVERRRDPSHVMAYSVRQWVVWFAEAGLEVQHLSRWWTEKPFAAWLARAQTPPGVGEALMRDVLALPPAEKAYFRVREGAGGLESLAHEAALAVGQKQR